MKSLISFLAILVVFFISPACRKDKGLAIGDSYQGGIIFYIDNTGEHGLIAAPMDQSVGIKWTNGSDSVRTTANREAIGTGMANTTAIVQQLGAGNYAAILCDQLVLNGYDDWYLPSREELYLLCDRRDKVGGFSDAFYWGSTDLLGTPPYYAINVSFRDGSRKFNSAMRKDFLNPVRAIRSF